MFVKEFCVFFSVILVVFAMAEHTTVSSEEQEDCGKGPCGWAVYNRFTRNIDFYMGNKCSCSPGLNCTRDDDDISITAYVYRCKDLKNNSTKS
ncbi:hypothetical protein HHI36_008840 [Cryptolaemus montrouzieri]|uniref:Uncharacterized protein n=1 Tax=Cryptolaemus montrouzieri TaxID=559131 RepID=A0ABD2MUF8_9CUCU